MIIKHLGILVTTYCNLNCRHCADLIPHRERCMYECEDVKRDLKKVLDAVECIEEVLIIGGEAFIYPWLEEVVDFCGRQEKIRNIIITTNGEIFPQKEVVECLTRNNVLIRISGYPEHVVTKRKENIRKYTEQGLKIDNLENMAWLNIGGSEYRNRTDEELKMVFSTCGMKECVCMNREGKIFFCSRQIAAYEGIMYPEPHRDEYIDVRNEEDLLISLRKFYGIKYINTCNYCDGISCKTTGYVPTAIQILGKEVFLELVKIYSYAKNSTLLETEKLEKVVKSVLGVFKNNEDKLIGIVETEKILLTIDKWIVERTEENWDLIICNMRELINVLSNDYNYLVDLGNISYARKGIKDNINMVNMIKIGTIENPNADIILEETDLLTAAREKYPIDTIEYNRIYIEGKLEKLREINVKAVVCGLSYTQYGIIEKNMPVSTLNLSVTSQDIPYSILMAKKALDLNGEIEKIIIPLSFYQGFYDMSMDDIELHQEVVSRINIPILKNSRNYKKPIKVYEGKTLNIFEYACDLEKYKKEYQYNLRMKLKDLDFFNNIFPRNSIGGLKFDYRKLTTSEKYESAKITAQLNERICTKKGYEEVKKYLKEFLEETRTKEVLFFAPPMTKYLYHAYHSELKHAYYEKVVSILTIFDNVKFLDLSDDKRFCDDDFCDFEHLSEQGAIKLTEIIATEFLA